MKVIMDAYYLGKQYSSMGIFQRNMIAQFAINDSIDELHIVTSEEPDSDLKYDNCYYHICGDSFIQKGRYIAKLDDNVKPNAIFYTFNLIPPMTGRSKALVVLQNHDWGHGQFAIDIDEKITGNIYQRLHRMSSKKADVNLSNSEFTSEETKKYAGKISKVIYHDADPIYKKGETSKISNLILYDLEPFNYIIYAGRVRPKYKNIHSLLLAFADISIKYKPLKLVIVHSDSFNNSDDDLIRKLAPKVISIKNISRLELKYLYENSLCMVYPSIYEGFGSPILEAQNSGTPVIAYGMKPMTEVGGNGAVYFDGRIRDLIDRITVFIEDSSARRNIIIKGFKNAERFDWKTTAEKTVEVFNEQ